MTKDDLKDNLNRLLVFVLVIVVMVVLVVLVLHFYPVPWNQTEPPNYPTPYDMWCFRTHNPSKHTKYNADDMPCSADSTSQPCYHRSVVGSRRTGDRDEISPLVGKLSRLSCFSLS